MARSLENPSKGAARRKIVAERMRAFHNALLEASAILPDFQKKIEQRIQQQPLWPSVVFWL